MWGFIASGLDPRRGLVLDVQNQDAKDSAIVQLYPMKPNDGQHDIRNQLWQRVGNFIVSGLDSRFVLDVTDLSRSPGTRVQLWTQHPVTERAPQQWWLEIPAAPPYFLLATELDPNLVLTAGTENQPVVVDARGNGAQVAS